MYKDHRLEETRVNTIVVYITTIAESLSILRRFSSFRVYFDSAYFMYKSIGIEEGRKGEFFRRTVNANPPASRI